MLIRRRRGRKKIVGWGSQRVKAAEPPFSARLGTQWARNQT